MGRAAAAGTSHDASEEPLPAWGHALAGVTAGTIANLSTHPVRRALSWAAASD